MTPAVLEGFRLSPQQRSIWPLQKRSPGLRTLCALALRGPVDPVALRRALRLVSRRHETLRTALVRRPGLKAPLQVVLEDGEPSWQELEPPRPDEVDLDERVRRTFDEVAGTAMDLEHGPFLEARLMPLEDGEHMLVLAVPAVLGDTGTLSNVARELAAILSGSGGASELPSDPVQYLEFSEWQHELLEGEEGEAGREFWRSQGEARPEPAVPSLEAEAGSGARPAGTPGVHRCRPDARLGEEVDRVAELSGATPATVLLTAWATYLARAGGCWSQTVWAACDGRKLEELQGALGRFSKAVPLVLRLGPTFRFEEALSRVGRARDKGYRWQDYLSPEEGPGIDDVGFAYERLPEPLAAGSVTHRFLDLRTFHGPCKLWLSALRSERGLDLELQYDPARFDARAVTCMAGQLVTALRSLVADSATPIGCVALLSEGERRRISRRLTGLPSDPSATPSVLERFAAQVERRPDAPALRFEERVLTYGELGRRARALSRRLRAAGAGPETTVGLLLDRGPGMVVGLLGTLGAGAAYAPLDPVLPARRLRSMLAALRPVAVVATRESRRLLPDLPAPVLDLDAAEESGDSAEGAPGSGGPGVAPEALAYVLFTSGSTGTPKPVGVEHRQIAAYVEAASRLLEVEPGDGLGLVSTFGADLGNTMLLPALCSGGCLHVITPERVADAEAMAEIFAREPVDHLKIVPTHLSALMAADRSAAILPRKTLVLGGESADWELVERVASRAPGCRILNHYGPTETTVGAVAGAIEPDGRLGGLRRPPLGSPLRSVRLRIVGPDLELMPTGLEGELWIAGAGVARGYLGRPGDTAERFVPDPTEGQTGARAYRTGDRVTLLADGSLEFLGRADDQVKLHGFRVELGEIDAVLCRHEAVREAVTVAREGSGGGPVLVAYTVAAPGAAAGASELRRFLQERLPDHMVPVHLVGLDRLPISPNGKVDRDALPEPPAPGTGEARGGFVPPRDFAEETLAQLWREVLGVERVGAHDDFFGLGGHSLLATQLLSRIRKVFQVELPLRALFDHPSLSGLAARIRRESRREIDGAPPLEPVVRDGELLLSPAQERLWFMHQLEPTSAAYNVPVAVRLTGELHLQSLAASLREVVQRHEVLRSRFPAIDGKPRVLISPEPELGLPVVDLSNLPESTREAEVRNLATREARRPFDLAYGPLVRATVVRLAARVHAALLTLHHIASDGWSSAVLVQEVSSLYAAFLEGRPSPLPDLPIQYVDYAAWLRRWFEAGALDEQLGYWRRQLEGAPRECRLPADRPRPNVRSFRGGFESFRLAPEVTERLRELARQEGVTLFMLLLAGFQTLLHRLTGEEDVVVGTDVANRNRVEIEPLIGFFVNNLVLRGDLAGNPTFRELLRRTRRLTIDAFSHQDVPFDRLVKELEGRRNLGRTPLFQVLFVLQNAPAPAIEVPDLELRRLDFNFGMSKFDLALFVTENRDDLFGVWNYSADLFERSSIQAMGRHMQAVLDSVSSDPDQRLQAVSLLTSEDRRARAQRVEAGRSERVQGLKNRRRKPLDTSGTPA